MIVTFSAVSRDRAMEQSPDHPLKPQLDEAHETLAQALEEACDTNEIEKLDTGELIRIEEILSIASDAAKRAVSLKRRLRDDAEAAGIEPERPPEAPGDRSADDAAALHRHFDDAEGRRWDTFAVYPTEDVAVRARLPEPYRHGWLAFDSGAEKRRLSPIPRDWTERSERELCELLERAQAVSSRLSSQERRPER